MTLCKTSFYARKSYLKVATAITDAVSIVHALEAR